MQDLDFADDVAMLSNGTKVTQLKTCKTAWKVRPTSAKKTKLVLMNIASHI